MRTSMQHLTGFPHFDDYQFLCFGTIVKTCIITDGLLQFRFVFLVYVASTIMFTNWTCRFSFCWLLQNAK